ncbi:MULTISPECIES: phage tail tape measure protein [unclassified Streptomyces]|uniref:phage tail tape measure protein n=1 Tax=unclassified Streptomyces TaxID=2593676 RepID=UPI00088CABDB|nr:MULTISPECIES: phage tail tape measure protein [unclassified Streptomyces]PBC72241.1 TP901 family phage tail tape measure protein [Streptomyces sp. 2321.6]SDR61998.1 phage tail tape measure protein, TP901 family, core region [Streptomyces sp. KS_16]SEE49459.1 phage tail tape measure protein, TP901 family, core region [Streptomyces sp. 2133.1]SNC77746.1 phage tail tape measure protein, TP901 family, core region [Streptomyces sp. 2114.4]
MANWNLSVDLRGNGTSLARALRESATHARTLDQSLTRARTGVRELDTAARSARGNLRSLGREARNAARDIQRLGNNARTTARNLGRYGDAARTAQRNMDRLGSNSRNAARDIARMRSQLTTAVRDLQRLTVAARTAATQTDRVGSRGISSMRRFAGETGRAHGQLRSMAALLSGGALVMGLAGMVKEGNEYQQQMNAFGAVTGATQMQMKRAAATANQLGNDLSLPGATAGDAAEAMVELAKAGFRTDQAISATGASLRLASAAQVNAADSAKYLGDIMDQFGMGADQASRAADTLASTANAASGDIKDIYYAMKYAGPVAHGLGVSIEETASAVGMLGKAGILGQTAGTTLRGMMANLAAPTPQMIEGLKAMGIEAWDASGQFKGLRYVIDGLSKAQHKMTQQDFAAAVKKSMGKPAMSGAIAMAHQGVDSFDNLMAAVKGTGSAADIAAAKGKGLAGAMLGLKTQARQTGLAIYQGMAPGMEWMTRGITKGLSAATPKIEKFFQYLNSAATLFGPEVGAALSSKFSAIGKSVSGMVGPLKDFGEHALAQVLHVLLSIGDTAGQVFDNVVSFIQPVVSGFSSLAHGSSGLGSAIDIATMALDAILSVLGWLSGVLGPIGHLVGGIVSAFGSLPGPVQAAVAAMFLFRRVQGPLSNIANTVRGRVTGAFQSLSQQMAYQRTLAGAAGQSLSRYGAAFAVLQDRVPIIGRMAGSFRTAAAAGSGFTGTLRGVAAAAGTGLRGAMSGLTAAMGGPWGVAIAGATVALGFLASAQQKAAQAAAEHDQRIANLSQALRESKGAVDDNVRAVAAQQIQDMKVGGGRQKLVDVMRRSGVTLKDLTSSYLGEGKSLGSLQKQLEAVAEAHTKVTVSSGGGVATDIDPVGKSAKDAAEALSGMKGEMKDSVQSAKELAAAQKGSGEGVSAYQQLKDSVAALADKTGDADSRTRALRASLDLLSGGSISLQAAQARVNEAITQANEAMATGVKKSDGWGKALVKTNGTIDTTTKNGQGLFNTLNNIASGSADAAIAAYDFAESQGKGLPEKLKASQAEMQKARDAAIKLGEGYGLSTKQAQGVADAMGLIPGQVSILLQTKGVDSTLAELLAVQAEFAKVPKSKTVKVDTLSDDAKKKLEELGYTVKLIPGTREYKVTAKTGQAKADLANLLKQMQAVPGGKNISMSAKTAGALRDLQNLKAAVEKQHGKTITMNVPTAEGRRQLELLGFKIQSTNGKTVVVSVPTGTPRSQVAAIQSAINSVHGSSATISVYKKTFIDTIVRKSNPGPYASGYQADGSVQVSRFAGGGMRRENHVAQIARAGEWRVWAEDETQGESYIPLARSKRPRSRKIAEETVRRLGGKGIAWNAAGSVTQFADGGGLDFTYSGTGAGAQRYTLSGLISASNDKKGNFNLSIFNSKLRASNNSLDAWRKDLATVASRAGQDVADALAEMGDEGIALTKNMAHGSSKYLKDMASQLRNLAASARASLGEYTSQLNAAVKDQATFQANLTKLAAGGYGALATRLASQNDQDAEALAAAAVKDKGKASSANRAATAANNALSSEQIAQLVQIIAAVKTSKTGIHDVAAATGLGEDDIVTVATKASAQIKSSLGSRSTKFLVDLARAQKGLSYANGGIRPGIYGTRTGAVTFAEPSTGGEAYIPLGANKRASATAVLGDVAHRFGVGLTDANAGRIVVISQEGPTTVNVPVTKTNASAYDIGHQVGRQMRRAKRGGVAARAGH